MRTLRSMVEDTTTAIMPAMNPGQVSRPIQRVPRRKVDLNKIPDWFDFYKQAVEESKMKGLRSINESASNSKQTLTEESGKRSTNLPRPPRVSSSKRLEECGFAMTGDLYSQRKDAKDRIREGLDIVRQGLMDMAYERAADEGTVYKNPKDGEPGWWSEMDAFLRGRYNLNGAMAEMDELMKLLKKHKM